MDASALELYDIFSGDWTREKAEQASLAIKKMARGGVKAEVLEKIEDRVEVQVEKTVIRESKDLATKGDLQKLEGRIDKLDGRIDKLDGKVDYLGGRIDAMFYWIAGIIVTMVLGFASVIVALFLFFGQQAR